MSRQDALDCLTVLQGLPNPPEYVIAYTQSSLFGKKTCFLAISPGIAEYCHAATDQLLADVLDFKNGLVTFRKTNKALKANRTEHHWGVVFLFEPERHGSVIGKVQSALKWIKDLSGLYKSISAIAIGLSVILGSVFGLHLELPSPEPKERQMNSRDNKKRIEDVLQAGFDDLLESTPYPNGLYYWRYSDGCDRRKLFARYSPYRDKNADKLIQDLSVRFTREEGWAEIFKAHTRGQYFVLKRGMMSQDNALTIAMERLNIETIVTVPTSTSRENCPHGYLSGGYNLNLSAAQEQLIITKYKQIILSIQAWESLEESAPRRYFAFTL